jgi:hypothetical protein
MTGIDPPTGPPPASDQAVPPAAESPAQRLRQLRRLITEQFTIAVRAGRLDIDLANGMLAGCGLPPLPRRWTVRLVMTFVCEVTAANAIDAFDTAQDAIAAAVTDATCPIDVDWDSREDVHATPGDIDPQAL